MTAAVRASALFVLLAFVTSGCGPDPETTTDPGSSPTTTAAPSDQQLNVTVLLDLSDRVSPEAHPASPPHAERDAEAVGAVVEAFLAEMQAKGAFASKGRIRTLFSPTPDNAEVNAVAQRLSKDLRGMGPADKKAVFDGLAAEYESGLEAMYASVLSQDEYVGADVWRFFKDGDAARYAVDPDPGVRNVLVVVTDGYAFHEQSRDRQDNRTAFVTGPFLDGEGLRASGWRETFDSGDYGFIDPGVQLPNLDVLVLEVDPAEGHPNDLDVIKAYWSKMFEEMGVQRYEILKSDLPTNTRPLILQFLRGE